MYYLVDLRGTVGNCASLWRAGGKGYTCDVNDAGLFTEEQALSHRETDLPVPAELVEHLAIRHVRIDHIRKHIDVEAYRKLVPRFARYEGVPVGYVTMPERRGWLAQQLARVQQLVASSARSVPALECGAPGPKPSLSAPPPGGTPDPTTRQVAIDLALRCPHYHEDGHHNAVRVRCLSVGALLKFFSAFEACEGCGAPFETFVPFETEEPA